MNRAQASIAMVAWLGGLSCVTCGEVGGDGGRRALRLAAAPAPCAAGTFVNSLGVCVPDSWYCGPMYYGAADGCDCDCGAADPDCGSAATLFYCYSAGRTLEVSSCDACRAEPEPLAEPDPWQDP